MNPVEVSRAQFRQQLELRLALERGKHERDAQVFSTVEGAAFSPDGLSRNWSRTVSARGLPKVMFHALRHGHASALIASGLDVLTISRRLGHGSPVVTLNTYAHLFEKTDRPRTPIGPDRAFRYHFGTISGFRQRGLPARCLIRLDGDVAERLKAAVC